VIVFESGGATPLETWDRILPAVIHFAPAVAYDRVGTGESPWDGLPPTPERVGARLRRLLAELEIAPPYVLVGHSWGGALVRYFVGNHPRGVAGVLYIDPTDITLTTADLISLFESIGAGLEEYQAFSRIQDQAMAAAPAPLQAEAEVVNEILRSDIERRALPSAPNVPTSVIVAGRVAVPPPNLLPFDTKAYADAMHRSQVSRLRRWVMGEGTFEVATNSGHFVQQDEPELVVAAIRRLVSGC
jgi:pimeloyl-ACP methyl ester carboxylesterase